MDNEMCECPKCGYKGNMGEFSKEEEMPEGEEIGNEEPFSKPSTKLAIIIGKNMEKQRKGK